MNLFFKSLFFLELIIVAVACPLVLVLLAISEDRASFFERSVYVFLAPCFVYFGIKFYKIGMALGSAKTPKEQLDESREL